MDANDYEYALSGAKDLVGCILDGADFSFRDLRDCDFERAHIQRCSFRSCDLTNANFLNARHAHSDFSLANLNGSKFNGSIFRLNFSGSDMRGCHLSGLFHECAFIATNLTGVDFSRAKFDSLSDFSDCIYDSATNFDGAQAVRPMLDFPVLFDYDLVRGVLVRRTNGKLSPQALDAIGGMRSVLKELDAHVVHLSSEVGIGHNNPPAEFQISSVEYTPIKSSIEAAVGAIESGVREPSVLERAIAGMKFLVKRVAEWITGKVDLFVDEVVKVGARGAALLLAAHLTGTLEKAVLLVERFMGWAGM